jgi:glycosyltransferase involved in cell wall biosynthesis
VVRINGVTVNAQGQMMADRASPRVLVVHSGARHNYALPAAFAANDMLEAFYTDACAGRGIGRLGALLRFLPSAVPFRGVLDRLAARDVPNDVLGRTRTFDVETIRYEISRRLAADQVGRHLALHESHRRRGDVMQRWGLGHATHVFNVLGEGGALLDAARDMGIPILADIIIALSTSRIVREEFEAFPDWGPEPVNLMPRLENGLNGTDRLLKTTDIFVCPSTFVADDLVNNWGVSPGATRIVPYALSGSWFDMRARPRRGRVLFVGSADRRKGIHYLAKAANILRARGRDYEFRVVGGVSREVIQHKEANSLNFLGRVSRTAIPEEFVTADVFVLPSIAEGSATVIYEALAMGVPVVTTKAAGSVVRDDRDGRIIAERDPEMLAEAIEQIIENRSLREKYSRSAKVWAQNFSWGYYKEIMKKTIEDISSNN